MLNKCLLSKWEIRFDFLQKLRNENMGTDVQRVEFGAGEQLGVFAMMMVQIECGKWPCGENEGCILV